MGWGESLFLLFALDVYFPVPLSVIAISFNRAQKQTNLWQITYEYVKAHHM